MMINTHTHTHNTNNNDNDTYDTNATSKRKHNRSSTHSGTTKHTNNHSPSLDDKHIIFVKR